MHGDAGTELWSTPSSSCANPCRYSRLQHIPFHLLVGHIRRHNTTGAGHAAQVPNVAPSFLLGDCTLLAPFPTLLSQATSALTLLPAGSSSGSSSGSSTQATAAALLCWCGALSLLSWCGKQVEKEKRGERERQAGNKWQFRCAQADGGVAGPLCRLHRLSITPSAHQSQSA
jgi:hypothetical protein